tara:strand:- start:1215 stop:1364 length:150 start_codon:yes stop_codon:yes gene_type:complete
MIDEKEWKRPGHVNRVIKSNKKDEFDESGQKYEWINPPPEEKKKKKSIN